MTQPDNQLTPGLGDRNADSATLDGVPRADPRSDHAASPRTSRCHQGPTSMPKIVRKLSWPLLTWNSRVGRRLSTLSARSQKIGMRSSIACNSGSSANLLAFATLCDPSVDGHIEPGAEVITSAVEFSTTVSPILQYGCVPVIVDADPKTGNLDLEALENALSRTRAVMSAHTSAARIARTMGREFADSHDLWFVEDNCDAGS